MDTDKTKKRKEKTVCFRIDSDDWEMFQHLCDTHGIEPSKPLRAFVERCNKEWHLPGFERRPPPNRKE